MTKWLVTYSRRRWCEMGYRGFWWPKTKAEARGIVDLMAIRKDHRQDKAGLKRGDLLEMVLIQTKGGSAARPTAEDIVRLAKVLNITRQKLSSSQNGGGGQKLDLFELKGNKWQSVMPATIFG